MSSLVLGQPDGFLVLAGALAWRYRHSWKGAVWVGALIAAKLLAWPLLLWLLITRRIRCSLVALMSAVAVLALSWAAIGFKGLLDYPRLLSADARAFATRSHSIVAAYLLLLFVPLAISRREPDSIWFLAATVFWISPVEPAHGWQIDLVIVAAIAVAIMSGRNSSRLPQGERAASTARRPSVPPVVAFARQRRRRSMFVSDRRGSAALTPARPSDR